MPPPPRHAGRASGQRADASVNGRRPRPVGGEGNATDRSRGRSTPAPGQDAGSARPRRRPERTSTTEQPRRRPPAPALPPDANPQLLDRAARAGLRSLPITLADTIAAHLVAAGQLLDDDAEAAAAHASYARQLAPRLAVVREAAAVTAYRTGNYADCLAELRALRRMTGDHSYLPVMADCERGLGRPERAIALSRDAAVDKLDPAAKAELAIVVSGARRDRGEAAAAVALLAPLVESRAVRPWTARLWYAYADALLDAGRRPDALRWFQAVDEIDEAEETDVEQRLADLAMETGEQRR